jgi:glycosyltransferase involved in cell wall biosynthesis
MNFVPLVSIIIPVYNVEQYIERCIRSLFEQTFAELEFVFVNDSTPDNSIKILEKVIDEYPERKDHVIIIHHENNRGVAAARNSGLNKARGEYFLQVDSDDWAETTMVEELYSRAVEFNSDIVWADFYVDFPARAGNSILKKQNVPEKTNQCINEILAGFLHAGLWNKLIKRNICSKGSISFPERVNMCEDLVFIILCLLHAERIQYINKAFYHYVQNADSITITRTRQSFESEFQAVKILEEKIPLEIFGISLMKYKARIKRNIFISGLFGDTEFINCFPESTPYIFLGLNKVERLAIWLSLKRNFLLARKVLSFGQKYSILKMTIRSLKLIALFILF